MDFSSSNEFAHAYSNNLHIAYKFLQLVSICVFCINVQMPLRLHDPGVGNLLRGGGVDGDGGLLCIYVVFRPQM